MHFSLRRASRLAVVALVAVFAPVAARAAAACTGVDVVARLRHDDPAGYRAFLAEAQQVAASDGLLWRIEKKGVAPSYLFGTFHAADPRLLSKVDRASRLIRGSRSVATELGDLSTAQKTLAGARAMLSSLGADNHSLSLVSEDKRGTIERLAGERGLDAGALDKMAPWMLMAAFALPVCELKRDNREIVDERIVSVARKAQVPVEALEAIDEQLDALKSIDPKLIGKYLDIVAERPSLIDDGFATMVALYARSRIGWIEPALKHGLKLTSEQAVLNEDVSKRLVIERNRTMAQRVRPLLEKGKAFVAVGALHLVGEQGLVSLLRKDGWRVTKAW
jgi:hypothetical protein